MNYYGQKETDKIICKYCDINNIGTCIEIGVANGINGSNTKLFEDMGWQVLCIDPIPQHVKLAKQCRKHVIECACGNEVKIQDFYVFDIGKQNILSSLSGLKPDPKLLVSHGHLINNCYIIKVQVKTLECILQDYKFPNNIDFISIDTEGTEIEVLQGINFKLRNIKLLVIENNHNDIHIEEYLGKQSFVKVERYFVNDFYINKEF